MTRKGITWGELIKISAAMGFLTLLVVIMIAGAIGANI